MAIFSVSFRIENDASYQKRYDSFINAISTESGNSTWEETTSQYIFESTKTSGELCSALYLGSDLLDVKDMILVIDLSMKSYAQRGVKYPHTLAKYLGNR